MSISKNLSGATLLNTVGRGIGFVRTILVGYYIGLTAGLDAYYTATAILTVLLFTFSDAFEVLGVTRMTKYFEAQDEQGFRMFTAKLFTFSMVLTLVVVIPCYLAVSTIVALFSPGYSAVQQGEVVKLMVYMIPMALFFLPFHAVGAALRARKDFTTYYLGHLINSAVLLGFFCFLHRDVYDIAIGASVAQGCALLFVLASVFKNIGFFGNPFDNETFREICKPLLPLLVLHFIGHINVYFERVFASYLPAGALAAFQYASMLAGLPVLMIPLATIYMPYMAVDENPMKRMLEGMLLILFVSVPIVSFTLFYGYDLVSVIYGYGKFDAAAVATTSLLLRVTVLFLPAFFVAALVYRLYSTLNILPRYAVAMLIGSLTNVAISAFVILILKGGVIGLALGSAFNQFAISIASILLLPKIHRSELSFWREWRFAACLIVVSVLASSVVWPVISGLDNGRLSRLVALIVSGILCMVMSYGFSMLLPFDVSKKVKAHFSSMFLKLVPVKT